jgi:hypothetical protein
MDGAPDADADDDRDWADFTAAQFLQGYADPDRIYDDAPLPNDDLPPSAHEKASA